MALKKTIADAIGKWIQKHPDAEKTIANALSDWLAKQPGVDNIEMPMRCTACSCEWTGKADLTKSKLADSVRQLLRCPICGAETSRIRK